jgi:L-iditol 2-dehydrogenase
MEGREGMPEAVKAAVMVAPGKVELQELPYPDHLEPGAVIVKMEMSGICGTDKHAFKNELRCMDMRTRALWWK